MTRTRLLSLAGATLLGAGLIVGCGGDGGAGDEDPAEVLERIFSGDAQVDSGVIDASVEISAEGEGAGDLGVAISGPFQSEGADALPQLALTVDASASGNGQELELQAGATATGDAGFLSYDGTEYELPPEVFAEFKAGFEESAAAGSEAEGERDALEQAGVDPVQWLTNLRNEGTTDDVAGTETIHISGDADVPRIVEDLQALVEAAGADPSQLDPGEIGTVEESITEARVDVWGGTEDDILRRLELTLALVDPEDNTFRVDLAIGIDELNEPQTIEAPTDARPFAELLPQLEGLGALGGIEGLEGIEGLDGGPEPAPEDAPPEGEAGAGDETPPSSEFLECIENAQSPEEIEQCAP